MEFLLFPASGLILAVVVFTTSQALSRRLFFYTFWLLAIIAFVVSILTFMVASADQRLAAVISYHGIFAIVGYIALVISLMVSQSQERTVLFSKLMEERQHRATSEITQLAASNSNLPELLNFSLDKIVSMLGLAGGAIHVFHRARENLVLGSYMGLSARLARRIETIEYGETAIGRTARNKRLLIIRDLRLSQDYEFFGGKQDGFSYMALVPIVSDGENWGVITLFGKGSYQPGSLQVDLLEQFGEQLGTALVLGRRVRNVQSSRDNYSSLVKSLGEELCDTSTVAGGPESSVRGLAWLVTRLFGGDRFDICTRSLDSWKIIISSESGVEGRFLQPTSEPLLSGTSSGVIGWDQAPPFVEFAAGKSYACSSLFGGDEWLFIRLEGRRKAPVDFELLSDSFRIVYGLYVRFGSITAAVKSRREKQPRLKLENPKITEALGRISGDLERLITAYSGSRKESDMRELFAWLETIKRSAKEEAGRAEPLKDISKSEETINLGPIVRDAIAQFTRQNGRRLEIQFEGENNAIVSDMRPEQINNIILEFLTAALFNSPAEGALQLSAKGDARAISLELRGSQLAPAPKGEDRPVWLSRLNGRMDCSRVEDEKGESMDYWRLFIPTNGEVPDVQAQPLNAVRILAVDSQDVIRDLLTAMLTRLGYQSTVVSNADDALLAFKAGLEENQPYSHIIADYSLEGASGLELARQFKALSPKVYFILISSWGLTPDPQNAARMGIDMMLKKPFRMEQLAEIIGAARQEV